jgi:hypothetical protein
MTCCSDTGLTRGMQIHGDAPFQADVDSAFPLDLDQSSMTSGDFSGESASTPIYISLEGCIAMDLHSAIADANECTFAIFWTPHYYPTMSSDQTARLSTVDPDRIYVVVERIVYSIHISGQKRETVAVIPFEPRCLVAGHGFSRRRHKCDRDPQY